MLIKRIYSARKGEGKTKWLVENAIDSGVLAQDKDELMLFYVGDFASYYNFMRTYESIMHAKCPIERWEHKDMCGCHRAILFTDDLMSNMNVIPSDLPEEGIWFITMDAGDFVNP